MGFLEKIFGNYSEKEIKKIKPIVAKIEALGPQYENLSDEELRGKTQEFKDRLAKGETLDDILPEAYAVARVGAVLKRSNQVKSSKLECGGIVIDKAAHQVTIDGKEIELSFKEFELLTYFMENRGLALSREKILNNVWNYDYFGDARTIDTHVKKLRSKMGEKGEYIHTIWGMGYKFEVE